jgi:hypothetical protein
MPSGTRTPRVPKYRRHNPSGQAVVTLSRQDFYLGRYGTRQSKAEYRRLVGEWLAGGGCLPRADDLTVAELKRKRSWQRTMLRSCKSFCERAFRLSSRWVMSSPP